MDICYMGTRILLNVWPRVWRLHSWVLLLAYVRKGVDGTLLKKKYHSQLGWRHVKASREYSFVDAAHVSVTKQHE